MQQQPYEIPENEQSPQYDNHQEDQAQELDDDEPLEAISPEIHN
jgi:hypothetical protein